MRGHSAVFRALDVVQRNPILEHGRLEIPYYIINVPRDRHDTELEPLADEISLSVHIEPVRDIDASNYKQYRNPRTHHGHRGYSGDVGIEQELPLFAGNVNHLILTLDRRIVGLSDSLANVVRDPVPCIVVRSVDYLEHQHREEQNYQPN